MFAAALLALAASSGSGEQQAAPSSLDCAGRELAYAVSRRVLSSSAALADVATALRLCPTEGAPVPAQAALPAFRREWAAAGAAAAPLKLFVATTGDDAHSGLSAAAPLRTPHAAQLRARVLRAATPGAALTIFMRQGTYYLNATLELTELDSGSPEAAVTWAALPGERVVLSGGRELPPLHWSPHGTKGAVVASVPPLRLQSGNIPGRPEGDTARVSSLFADGARQWPARWPNANPDYEIWPAGWHVAAPGSKISPLPPANTSQQAERITNEKIGRNVTGTRNVQSNFSWWSDGADQARFFPPDSFWQTSVMSGVTLAGEAQQHAEAWAAGLAQGQGGLLVHTNDWPAGWGGTWTFNVSVSAAAPFASPLEASQKRLHRASTAAARCSSAAVGGRRRAEGRRATASASSTPFLNSTQVASTTTTRRHTSFTGGRIPPRVPRT